MKIKVNFPEKCVKSPMLSEIILKTGILVSIVSSHVDSKGGEMILEILDSNYELLKESFETRGAFVSTFNAFICKNEDECVDCGACISVCPSHVFGYSEDWSLTMDMQKCVRCALCIDMCPHQALALEETDLD